MILSKCAICGDKKSRFIKNQEAKNPKYDGYQRGLASMANRIFDKKSAGSGVNMHANNKIKQNHQLAEEFYKPFIKKFQERTVYLGLKGNILSADLVDMQLISKFNKRFASLIKQVLITFIVRY